MMRRRVAVIRWAIVAAIWLVMPSLAIAQQAHASDPGDSVSLAPNYWPKFVLGGFSSILAHEAAHVLTSIAVGGSPRFGFDEGRPTIYSGIDSHIQPHKQFLFSASGLVMQSVIDEGILDIPHHRGSAFERGVLAGGIGTTLFYLTIGRTGSVSDVDFIARTHAMSKVQTTLVFGSIAALHTIRISRDHHYANFFARPAPAGRVDVGVNIDDR